MTSDNIRAGDVVVCVDARTINDPHPVHIALQRQALNRLREGSLYRVAGIRIAEGNLPEPALVLRGIITNDIWPGWTNSFRAWRFRKIDAAEDCFTKAMRSLIPLETTVA